MRVVTNPESRSNAGGVIELEVKGIGPKHGRVIVKAMVPASICEDSAELDDVTPVALCVAHALVSACSEKHAELGPVLLGFEATLGMHRVGTLVDEDGVPVPIDKLVEEEGFEA